mmetsp:Transcript_101967/g.255538  ORF Transcript_101967/g.255538 Transcript_101967/m.255538 type:complete len:822 (-) Transcript_101967:432-2897(-)|eukprot:CAMPEP_0115301546 /NCGR_PEP_ID=MMETSP0270-20121206/69915_1 /TAXON_ID=71861 /ORGANISM="Scrippsiella trochoidea, Strain CCMP3099" /LENGTH=821 /DNA_ID=CAMNT_0002719429 /DNA_START=72 /DNA_END=2537 /DNA_ORIENTATION=-
MVCDGLPADGSPAVCQVGGGGLILPLGGDGEQEWPTAVRAPLYLIGLLWCFLGVAIIADVFMGAIEKVTSKRVLIYDKALQKHRTKSVWNPTVANLTLMALGSSAPEILLNVIGIFPTFQSSELGPSTIVGSAAFNLLCITAVCVVSIPAGEYRKIKDRGVFGITAFFSVFAYVWLLVILMLVSPDVVDTVEGVVTFLFFWVLVVLAFLADTGKLPGTAKPPAGDVVHPQNTPAEIGVMEFKVRQKYGKNRNLNSDEVSNLIAYEFFAPESRAKHRINGTRVMSGGKKVFGNESPWEKGMKLAKELQNDVHMTDVLTSNSGKPEVSFQALNYTVLESVGKVGITVRALGELVKNFSVEYSTCDGTAIAKSDYEPISGKLEFGPQKLEHVIEVAIISTEGHEPTEEFYLDLKDPGEQGDFVLGNYKRVTVVVIDEDPSGGRLGFEQEHVKLYSSDEPMVFPVSVCRKGGTSGRVACSYCCESDSAIAGSDFEAVEGKLEFEVGQKEASFNVKIMPKGRYENDECFRIILKDIEGEATFDATTDGGNDSCIMTVIIMADTAKAGAIQALSQVMRINWDAVEVGNATYKQQFVEAIYPGGSAEAMKEVKPFEWVMHILSVPWKLLFALVPPTHYAGGWVCFFCALGMVGFVTVIIGDMAELLGCVLDIPPATTAITLVALGTSLPDTFASRTAAQMDPYADNSIGNVTGSNSVNVFLGLGLPWMICAIYWQFVATCEQNDSWYLTYPSVAKDYPDGIFVVKAGSLGISVIAFSACACLCLATLVIRRIVLGGELGGQKPVAFLTAGFFVFLWLVYIVVSIAFGD